MRVHNPALDGIRTLACLAVVAIHLGVGPTGAGWLGVDIFFVLSGYLITGLLLEEKERTGQIRLRAFYIRRLTRLYPALLVACVLAVAFGRTGTTVGGAAISLAYLSDVWLARGGDLGALGPTWSLAIEEHFYMLWPLVLVALKPRNRVAAVAAVFAAISLIAFMSVNPPGRDLSVFAYNADHLRAWELLAGCVLAAAPRVTLGFRSEIAALAAAAAGVLACSWTPLWPAGRDVRMAIIAVGVATILVVSAEMEGVGRRILSLWPLPQLGVISYGIYLFHVPVIDLVSRLPVRRAVELAVTLPLIIFTAWASHRYIEAPVRRWGRQLAEKESVSIRSTVLEPSDRSTSSSVDDSQPRLAGAAN